MNVVSCLIPHPKVSNRTAVENVVLDAVMLNEYAMSSIGQNVMTIDQYSIDNNLYVQ